MNKGDLVIMKSNSNIKYRRNITLFSNLVEWYDFIVFASLASIISKVFLPPELSDFSGLVITFTFFTATYLLRPIGGYILGTISDKYGRVFSFKISVSLMVFGTLAISLSPTYNTIGLFSVLLLIVARMAQAFSIGGEFLSSSALVYESAPTNMKIFMTSFINTGVAMGVIIGALTIFLLRQVLDENQMMTYGWRIPFLISSLLFICVWIARKKHIINDQINTFSSKIYYREYRVFFIALFFLLSFGGVAFYTFTVMSSTIFTKLEFSSTQSLIFTITGIFTMMVFEPLAGKLADILGIYKVLVFGVVGIMLLSILHTHIILSGEKYLIYIVQICYGAILAMYMGVTPGFLCSLVKKEDRCRILGLGYNVPLMIFGGTTPLIVLYLMHWSYYACSIYLISTCVLSLCGMYLLHKRGESYDY